MRLEEIRNFFEGNVACKRMVTPFPASCRQNMGGAGFNKIVPDFFGEVFTDSQNERLEKLIDWRLEKRIETTARRLPEFLDERNRGKGFRRAGENPNRTLTVAFHHHMNPLVLQKFPVIKFPGVARRFGPEKFSADPHPAPERSGFGGIKKKDLNLSRGLE